MAGGVVWLFGAAGGVGTSTVAGILALEAGVSGQVRVVDVVGDGSPWAAWAASASAAGERDWSRVPVAAGDTTASFVPSYPDELVVVDAGRASLRPDRWDGWDPAGPVVIVVASAAGPIDRAERVCRVAATCGQRPLVVVVDVVDGRRPSVLRAGVAALRAHYEVREIGHDRSLRVGGLSALSAVSAATWKAASSVLAELRAPSVTDVSPAVQTQGTRRQRDLGGPSSPSAQDTGEPLDLQPTSGKEQT